MISCSTKAALAGATVLAGLAMATAARAAETDPDWTVKATLASEYMSKGAGKSDGEPALQLEAAYEFGKVEVGVWGSNATSSQGADAEVQLFVATEADAGPVAFEMRAMVKHAPGTQDGVQDSWLELRGEAEVEAAGNKLRLRVEYSPDNYAASKQAWWVEAQVSRKLSKDWKVSAAYGAREQDGGADYRAWNAGVTWKATDRLSLDLRWYDTDYHQGGDKYDGRVFASATVSF